MIIKKQILTGLMLTILSISTAFAQKPQPRVKIIADFEGTSPLNEWKVREEGSGADVKNIKVGLSEGWALEGKHSAEFHFKKYEKGEGDWRVVEFKKLSRTSLGDWRGWDTFEFDARNPGKETAVVRVTVQQENKRVYAVWSIEPGTWRMVIPVRRPKEPDADLSKITAIQVVMRNPERDTVVFLDNFRLVDQSPVRAAELVSRIETAAKMYPNQAAQYMDYLKQAQSIELTLSQTEEPGKREELVARMTDIEQKVRSLMILSVKDMVLKLADGLAVAEQTDVESIALDGSKIPESADQVEDLTAFLDTANELLSEKRLEVKMRRHFPDADFAVGIPSSPITLTRSPKTYDGSLGTSIKVSAARREYEPFQLVILPKDKSLKNVSLAASPLKGPSTIAAECIEIAPMGWRKHPIDGLIQADMLRTDIQTFDVPADVQQPVWVNVFVPENTPAGDYEGYINITSENAGEQKVKVNLTVWTFTLPKYPSMQTAFASWGESKDTADDSVKLLLAHRFSPANIYQATPVSPENLKKWSQWGGTNFNIMRIDRMGTPETVFTRNKDGELRLSEQRRNFFLNHLDRWVQQIKKTDFDYHKHCYFYGFDEVDTSHVPAMEEIYGELKERYGPIRTSAAINLPLWEEYPDIKNLDIWVIIGRLLSPEVRDDLQAKGREVWWYNLFADNRDPVACRVQFWGTFKDRLDGVLHYSLAAGGGWDPYGPTLYSPDPRPGDSNNMPWGGLIRRNAKFFPLSTVALEYWREGLEDCDYLAILRDLRDQLDKQPNARQKHKYLLAEADRMISVPENITNGIIAGEQEEQGEITIGFQNNTDNMETLLFARQKTAELIVRIQEVLEIVQ